MAGSSRNLPADEVRCTRSGHGNWRCPFPRHGGTRYCRRHCSQKRAHKSDPAAGTRASNTEQEPPSRVSDPKPGEIWAFAGGSDNLPRSYARIDRIVTSDKSARPLAEATPLIALPASDDEMNLSEKGFLLAAGTFSTSKLTITKPVSTFTHPVSNAFHAMGKWSSFYKIFPKEGEVWALYQNYDALLKCFEYKLVEILSDFSEGDGVNVFGLVKVEEGVYKRQLFDGFYMMRSFSRKELSMFSHQVPASGSVDGGEKLWKVMLH